MSRILPILFQSTGDYEEGFRALEGQTSSIKPFDAALADRLKHMIDRLRARLNLLVVLRDGLKAFVEQTAYKLQAKRMFMLEDLEKPLEAKKGQYLVLSLIAEKAKAQHQKGKENLEAAKHSVEEAERALAGVKAKEAELLQAAEVFRMQARETEDQASVASACVTSLEEER